MVIRVLIALAITLPGCTAAVNSFNMPRVAVKKSQLIPNTDANVYRLIDTAAIYMSTAVNGADSVDDGKGGLQALKELRIGIKFYQDGRVGHFRRVDCSDIKSLQPGRARMGIYQLSEQTLWVSFISESPQAGIFSIKQKAEIRQDTLLLKNKEYVYKYVKQPLPADYLIYKPDW